MMLLQWWTDLDGRNISKCPLCALLCTAAKSHFTAAKCATEGVFWRPNLLCHLLLELSKTSLCHLLLQCPVVTLQKSQKIISVIYFSGHASVQSSCWHVYIWTCFQLVTSSKIISHVMSNDVISVLCECNFKCLKCCLYTCFTLCRINNASVSATSPKCDVSRLIVQFISVTIIKTLLNTAVHSILINSVYKQQQQINRWMMDYHVLRLIHIWHVQAHCFTNIKVRKPS